MRDYQDICLDSYLATVCPRDRVSLALMVLVCDHSSADDDDLWMLARHDIDRDIVAGIPSIDG